MKKLVIISAPSGSGKTTLVKEVLKEDFNLKFSISACSRTKRTGEIQGKDYYFLGIDEFKHKINNNEFVEWEEVYKNNFYGTLKSEVQSILEKNQNIIFDIDVIGGLNIKKQYMKNSISIFIMPPSIKELENRLRNRNTDSEENIKKRIAKAGEEIKLAKDFDKIIINDDLQNAVKKMKEILKKFLN